VVLLDATALVVDVQGRNHAVGEHPGAKAPRRAFGHTPAEDELHLVRTAEVEILANHLLEEDAPRHRLVEHLGEGELGLQDGQRVGVRGLAIRPREGLRQTAQPLAHDGSKLLGAQAVTDRLQARGSAHRSTPLSRAT